MKRRWMLMVLVAFLCFSRGANATLTTIGTATYGGAEYNLIYEEDQSIVWIDYTRGPTNWQSQMDWADSLNDPLVLTCAFNPGVTISWEGDWRLPTISEMVHLYYESLGNLVSPATPNTSPFNGLQSFDYWSGTEHSLNPNFAWLFHFGSGAQGFRIKGYADYALAVGQVSPVPEPATMLLLGCGLFGLGAFRRRVMK